MFLKLTDQYGKLIILNTERIDYMGFVNSSPGSYWIYSGSNLGSGCVNLPVGSLEYKEPKLVMGVHCGDTLHYLSEESSNKLQKILGVNNDE